MMKGIKIFQKKKKNRMNMAVGNIKMSLKVKGKGQVSGEKYFFKKREK